MGTIQNVITAQSPEDIIFIKDAVVLWRSEKQGPRKGNNGDFYTFSLLVSDGSVPKDAEGKDGVFVNFSYHPNTAEIMKGDHVQFKLKYGTYKNKLSLRGSYLEKVKTQENQVSSTAHFAIKSSKNTLVEEYESLIKNVVDPLFNAFWDRMTQDEQQTFFKEHQALIEAINKYLPEDG